MEIFKDDKTGLEYVYFEDVLDEGIEIDNTTRLLINSMILDYVNSLIREFIELNGAISLLQSNLLTHDELIEYKCKFKELYYDINYEYECSKENDGYWEYINDYTFEQLYNDSFPNKNLKLSEIFEDDNFYKNIMKIKEK